MTQIDGCSCLYVACQEGHLEVAKVLIQAGGEALLLMTDSVHGCSCLHAACFFGHSPIVAYLLSLSCVGLIGLRDRSGRTALELAVAQGHAGAAEAMRAAASGRGATC
jgi:ankyrin repeat protein